MRSFNIKRMSADAGALALMGCCGTRPNWGLVFKELKR